MGATKDDTHKHTRTRGEANKTHKRTAEGNETNRIFKLRANYYKIIIKCLKYLLLVSGSCARKEANAMRSEGVWLIDREKRYENNQIQFKSTTKLLSVKQKQNHA